MKLSCPTPSDDAEQVDKECLRNAAEAEKLRQTFGPFPLPGPHAIKWLNDNTGMATADLLGDEEAHRLAELAFNKKFGPGAADRYLKSGKR